jgi:hypothetical protein
MKIWLLLVFVKIINYMRNSRFARLRRRRQRRRRRRWGKYLLFSENGEIMHMRLHIISAHLTYTRFDLVKEKTTLHAIKYNLIIQLCMDV